MKKARLIGVAPLFLATGAAHAKEHVILRYFNWLPPVVVPE